MLSSHLDYKCSRFHPLNECSHSQVARRVCVGVCDQLWRVTAAGGEDRAESDKRLIGLRGEQLGVFLFERHVL